MADLPIDSIVGRVDGKPFYRITISPEGLRRVRELTLVDQTPTWWLVDGVICSTDPQWFIDLDRKLQQARRPG